MIGRLLRTISLLACAFVLLSWTLFGIDELRDASNRTSEQVAGRNAARTPDPSPRQERDRERAHTTVREAIDDVDDVLVAPFASIVDSSKSVWVRRTVPMLIALFAYGFLLSFLARFAAGRP